MKMEKRITFSLEPHGRAAELVPRNGPANFDELVIDVDGENQAVAILTMVEAYFIGTPALITLLERLTVGQAMEKDSKPEPKSIAKPPTPPPTLVKEKPQADTKVAASVAAAVAADKPPPALQPQPSAPAASNLRTGEVYDSQKQTYRALAAGEPTCKGPGVSDGVPCRRACIEGAKDAAGLPACDKHAVSPLLPAGGVGSSTKPVELAKPAVKAAETAPQAPTAPSGQGGSTPSQETPQKPVSADPAVPFDAQPASTPAQAASPPGDGGALPYTLPPHVAGAQMLRDVVSWLREPLDKGGRGLKGKDELLPELEKLKPHITCVRQVKDLPKRLERVLAIFDSETQPETATT